MQSLNSPVFIGTLSLFVCATFNIGAAGSAFGQAPAAAAIDESPSLPPLPAGEAIFVFPPESARKMLLGVQIARGRQRVTAAQYYLKMLIQSRPSPAELLRLRDEFGVGVFLELNADPTLQPDAGTLLKLVNAASQVSIPSDARLDQLVGTLAADGVDSKSAILEILSANDRAVRPLLAADPSTPSGRLAATILASNVFELRHGLVKALDSADEPTQIRIVRMLGYCADDQIAYDLLPLKYAPDSSPELQTLVGDSCSRLLESDISSLSAASASQWMDKEVLRLLKFAGQRLPNSSSWNDRADMPVSEKRQAAVQRAIEVAADSVATDPSSLNSKALLWLAELSATPADLTLSVPDHSSSTATPGEFCNVANVALSFAKEFDALPGEVNILKLIHRRLQDGQQLTLAPAAIIDALDSADPRVRIMAAAVSRFVESGAVDVRATRILNAAREAGVLPDAVVIDGNQRLAADLAASISDAGYTTQISSSGIDGFETAVSSVSCAAVFVHASSGQWDVSGTVANLRADARTRATPIVIYGPEYTRKSGERLAARYRGVWFISEPLLPVPSVTNPPITLVDQMRLEGIPDPALSVDDLQALKGLLAIMDSSSASE